jgi:hypothetical protein
LAEELISSPAPGAIGARAIDPLDACVVPNFELGDAFANFNDNSGALENLGSCDRWRGVTNLMATDNWKLWRQLPVSLHGVNIAVTHAGILEINKDLPRTGLLDGNLPVNKGYVELLV